MLLQCKVFESGTNVVYVIQIQIIVLVWVNFEINALTWLPFGSLSVDVTVHSVGLRLSFIFCVHLETTVFPEIESSSAYSCVVLPMSLRATENAPIAREFS
jgi:hypothetical protein